VTFVDITESSAPRRAERFAAVMLGSDDAIVVHDARPHPGLEPWRRGDVRLTNRK
jgi:hypothetical protein